MSVGFTFGSVGDILQLCILVKDLINALDSSRGSSAEYRELIRELSALDRVLLEVEQLSWKCVGTAELNALQQTVQQAALQCRQPIQEFLTRIRKFEKHLGESDSKGILKTARDAYWKVHWAVSYRDELQKFRAIINSHKLSINTLLITAGMYDRLEASC
jgi:hypothetical protein